MGVCAQCKRTMPVMERAARELGDTLGVQVLDIRQEEDERLAERFKIAAGQTNAGVCLCRRGVRAMTAFENREDG
jgi:thiol-disulfide isomerase/thioredoxin